MAVQTPFFGKRDNDAFSSRNTPSASPAAGNSSAATGAASPSSVGASVRNSSFVNTDSGGSKLTVGPNIKLKGVEITDCDTLVVEGTVEATMDSRVIQIAEQGAFHGTAEIDIAEIHGVFDGTLTVREKLTIFGTGRVSGKIRYGKVVIEEGGELSGQIEAGVSGRKQESSPGVFGSAGSSAHSSSANSSGNSSGSGLSNAGSVSTASTDSAIKLASGATA